jgi:hypothetical protein
MARLTRAAELVRVRRGAYALPTDEPLSPRASHLRLLAATVGQTSPELVVSHMSAADHMDSRSGTSNSSGFI